ncbi:unnamed protein product, partial [Effrenium voratum]
FQACRPRTRWTSKAVPMSHQVDTDTEKLYAQVSAQRAELHELFQANDFHRLEGRAGLGAAGERSLLMERGRLQQRVADLEHQVREARGAGRRRVSPRPRLSLAFRRAMICKPYRRVV